MRHLGILAHSAEGAALCLRTFCQQGSRELGPHQHPDVTLDCIAFGRSMPAWDAGDFADIIFGELVEGVFTGQARSAYAAIIGKLRERGCDAVALACTEIPLLIDARSSPLPVLDSTRLLAAAAFDVAAGRRPLPSWRGGALAQQARQDHGHGAG